VKSRVSKKIKRIFRTTDSFRSQLQYLLLFVVLFISLSLLLWNVSSTISRGYREKAKFDQISQEISDKENEVEGLKAELSYAQSDRSAEEGARDVLGMIYPGEDVIFVDEGRLPSDGGSEADSSASDSGSNSSVEYTSNLEGWLKLFFY
jgi:cell division protein FtsB